MLLTKPNRRDTPKDYLVHPAGGNSAKLINISKNILIEMIISYLTVGFSVPFTRWDDSESQVYKPFLI